MIRVLICLPFILLCSTIVFAASDHEYIDHEELFKSRTHYQAQLSPNSEFVSYLRQTENDIFLDLYDIKEKAKKPLIKVSRDDFSIGSYTWLNKRIVLLNLYKDNTRIDYLYTFQRSDENAKKSFSGKYFKINDGYIVDEFAPDPNRVIYAKNSFANGRETQMLYKISIDDLKRNQFKAKDKIDDAPKYLVRYGYDLRLSRILGRFVETIKASKNEDSQKIIRIAYRDIDINKWHYILTLNDVDYKMEALGFIDEDNLAVLSNKETDKVALQVFNLSSESITKTLYQHDKYDLTSAVLSDTGQPLAVNFIEQGITQTEWLSEQGIIAIDTTALKFSKGEPLLISHNKKAGTALLYVRGSNNAGEFYFYQDSTSTAEHIVSMYPSLEQHTLAKTISYKVNTSNDVAIEAFLTQPNKGSLNHNSLIVMPHGGPIGVRDYSVFNPTVQFLANRGFSVLQVNFRGSIGYGKDFMKQGVGQFGQLIEEDITLVVDDLLSKQSFDNICALGASYGAYSSVTLAMDQPNRYKCVVASFGVFDLPLLFNTSNYRSGEKYSEWIARVVGENNEEKIRLSPVYRAKDLQAPTLIIAGKLDRVTGYEQANRMRFMLEEEGKPVEFLVYDESGHGHYTWQSERHYHLAMVDFLYRSLSLKITPAENLEETNRSVIADYYADLGHGVSEDGVVREDTKKALEYFVLASEYGDPLATFNVGAHYHRGEHTERSIRIAVDYYLKSLELGYHDAHERLAFIYMFDPTVAQHDEKALFHLNEALKHEDSFSNKLKLSAFPCVTQTEQRNVENCIKQLKKTRKLSSDKADKATFKYIVSQILAKGNYSPKEAKALHAFVRYSFDLRMDSYEIAESEKGLFYYQKDEKFGYAGKYLKHDSTSIEQVRNNSKDDVYLGLRLHLDNSRPPTTTQNALLSVIWQAQHNNGDLQVLSTDTIIGSSKGGANSYLYLPTQHEKGLVYAVKVYDSFGKLRYSHVFEELK